MVNRRSFLKKAALAGLGMALPGFSCSDAPAPARQMKTNDPCRAAVFYYSQTGHTRRMATVIAGAWNSMGIETDILDIREAGPVTMPGYDLVMLGSPEFYWDTPENVKAWIGRAPDLAGTPVAAYVTYGGGGNSRNSAMTMLELAAARGGIPAGIAGFANMSAFAPTWSIMGPERTLRLKDLPSEETFAMARRFAAQVVHSVRAGSIIPLEREITMTDPIRGTALMGLYRMAVNRHGVNQERCVQCGTCTRLCPVAAINPQAGTVDRVRCLLCLGCVNNCPAGAVEMTFLGHEVYGFYDMLSRNNVVIHEPTATTE